MNNLIDSQERTENGRDGTQSGRETRQRRKRIRQDWRKRTKPFTDTPSQVSETVCKDRPLTRHCHPSDIRPSPCLATTKIGSQRRVPVLTPSCFCSAKLFHSLNPNICHWRLFTQHKLPILQLLICRQIEVDNFRLWQWNWARNL